MTDDTYYARRRSASFRARSAADDLLQLAHRLDGPGVQAADAPMLADLAYSLRELAREVAALHAAGIAGSVARASQSKRGGPCQ